MTEKYAVLIKYKYLEYIDSAKLSNDDAWTFLKSIIEYDKTGTEPIYSNPILSGLFAVVKIDLDKNKENYETVSQERSKAGKEGAKKRWGKVKNNKDSKDHNDIAKMANAKGDSNCYDSQKNIAKMHDLDLDSDLEEFNNNEKKSDFPPGSSEDRDFSTAEAVVDADFPAETPKTPPDFQNKPIVFSVGNSPPPKRQKWLELTPEQNALYLAVKACFESSDNAKAIMYQDRASAGMQMRKLKEIIIRCSNIAPGITVDFLKNVLEHFRIMTNNAKYKGSWVFTPRCLSTHWIWEIVISSLPKRETDLDKNIQESIKGLFNKR
jgi:hypothetical protein